MAETTAISWATSTFNTWWGCVKVSGACKSCYALAWDKRTGGDHWGPTARRRFFGDKHWAEPLNWEKKAKASGEPWRVFCSSMADVFEQLPLGHPDAERMREDRARLFRLIETTPSLTWLLLTKRPENIAGMVPHTWLSMPRRNVWLGTTVEDMEQCVRIPTLRAVPAAVHFLSCEPLLEGIRPDLTGIDWAIIGGESGPGARSFDVAWARSLRDQCAESGVAFFMKQLGAHTRMSPDGGDPLPMFFKKHQSADFGFMPEDLRVRQFPEARHA